MPVIPSKREEVAVVVPCYNVENCLGRALDSVFAQTFCDYCVYAVDDGSTDGTSRVQQRYADRGVCVRQLHSGQAAARNRGIRMSESPFIAFLDADDQWLPTKLERQIAWLKNNPAVGMVFSRCASGEVARPASPAINQVPLPASERPFEQLVRDCDIFTPTVVVRRECLEEVGLFNESLTVCEDFNLWLRIAARWKIAVIPEVLAIRHLRPKSLSLATPAEERLLSGIAALEHVESACSHLSIREKRALRRALAERVYLYGSYLLASGAKAASRTKLVTAMKLRSTHGRAIVKLGLSYLPASLCGSLLDLGQRLGLRLRSEDPAEI